LWIKYALTWNKWPNFVNDINAMQNKMGSTGCSKGLGICIDVNLVACGFNLDTLDQCDEEDKTQEFKFHFIMSI